MKGAFEFCFIFVFSMPLLVFGINFMQIAMSYNQARQYQNYAVTQIEHQNRFDESVNELIDEGKKYCSNCELSVIKNADRYDVKVTFPIRIPLINYSSRGVTHSLTQVIK